MSEVTARFSHCVLFMTYIFQCRIPLQPHSDSASCLSDPGADSGTRGLRPSAPVAGACHILQILCPCLWSDRLSVKSLSSASQALSDSRLVRVFPCWWHTQHCADQLDRQGDSCGLHTPPIAHHYLLSLSLSLPSSLHSAPPALVTPVQLIGPMSPPVALLCTLSTAENQ